MFSVEKLRAIATQLNLVPPPGSEHEADWHRLDEEFLRELLVIYIFYFSFNLQ